MSLNALLISHLVDQILINNFFLITAVFTSLMHVTYFHLALDIEYWNCFMHDKLQAPIG